MTEPTKNPMPFPNEGGRYVIGEQPKPAATASVLVSPPKNQQTAPIKTPEDSAK